MGITAADGFTVYLDYYQALAEIARRFPSATKVVEVPAAEADENLDHVLDRIAAVRAGGWRLGRDGDQGELLTANAGDLAVPRPPVDGLYETV